MSYLNQWNAALERTKRFNFSSPAPFNETSVRYFNDKRFRQLDRILAPVFEDITDFQQLVGQCLSIHLSARPVLEKWLQCPVYFTLGWVDDGTEKGIYRFDDETIEQKLKNGHNEETIDIHAWLTLPSMEILDLTLTTTLCMQQKLSEGIGEAIAMKADEIKELTYKPMLVGEDYLKQIGLLKNFTVFEFGC